MFSARRFTGSSEPGSEPWAVQAIPRVNTNGGVHFPIWKTGWRRHRSAQAYFHVLDTPVMAGGDQSNEFLSTQKEISVLK